MDNYKAGKEVLVNIILDYQSIETTEYNYQKDDLMTWTNKELLTYLGILYNN